MAFGTAQYDALVGANAPAEKAKAVVQALEKEMLSQLATKQDLQQLKAELKHDLTLRLGAMMVASPGILFGLLKAFCSTFDQRRAGPAPAAGCGDPVSTAVA